MDQEYFSLGEECTCTSCKLRKTVTGFGLRLLPPDQCIARINELRTQVITAARTLKLRHQKLQPALVAVWRGSKRKAREDLLRHMWSEMPESSRPALELFEALTQATGDTSHIMEAFLYPHINMENLIGRDDLLHLLEARVGDTPNTFAVSDLQNATFTSHGHHKATEGEHNDTCVVFSADSLAFEKYATICPLADVRCADPRFSLDVGLAIVTIQCKLYRMLLGVTDRLLKHHKLDIPYLVSKQDATALELGDRASQSVRSFEFKTFSNQALDRPPTRPDLHTVREIALSRRQLATTHLLRIREDPALFLMQAREWTANNAVDYWQFKASQISFEPVAQMILSGYLMFWQWGYLEDEFDELLLVKDATEYDLYRVQRLYDLCSSLASQSAQYLGDGLICSRAFPKYFQRRDTPRVLSKTSDGTVLQDYEIRPTVNGSARRLCELLLALCSNEAHCFGAYDMVVEIDALLDGGNTCQELLEAWHVERYAALAGAIEVQAQLQILHPWAYLTAPRLEEAAGEVHEVGEHFAALREKITSFVRKYPVQSMLSDLTCEPEPTADKAIKDQQRKACRNLAAWWTMLDEELEWRYSDNSLTGKDWTGEELAPRWNTFLEATQHLEYLWQMNPVCEPTADASDTPSSASDQTTNITKSLAQTSLIQSGGGTEVSSMLSSNLRLY